MQELCEGDRKAQKFMIDEHNSEIGATCAENAHVALNLDMSTLNPGDTLRLRNGELRTYRRGVASAGGFSFILADDHGNERSFNQSGFASCQCYELDVIEIVRDDAGDTLTIHFWRDGGYNGRPCPDTAPWACHIGENYIEGAGGFGASQLDALRNLCDTIARDGGHLSDQGRICIGPPIKDEP